MTDTATRRRALPVLDIAPPIATAPRPAAHAADARLDEFLPEIQPIEDTSMTRPLPRLIPLVVLGGLIATLAHYLETRMHRKLLRPLPDAAVAARLIIEASAFWAVHRHWDPRPQIVEETIARDTVVQFVLRALGKEKKL